MEPEKFGPFTIGRVLGRGGMGAVYEGTSDIDGSIVAVKVLSDVLDDDAEDRLRFESEIETLKRLRHPNIVRLAGFGEEQGRLYFAMEYVDGTSLQQELKKRRMFQWYETAKIGLEICQALRHAHDRGVIHRDIKPANILLDHEGNIKLSDFGIARFFGAQQITDVHSIIGTLEYMSPEQTLGSPISAAADLYSLGCVLYFLLTCKPPFSARTLPELHRKHLNSSPVPIYMVRQDVPKELGLIIGDLLKIRPDERPRNAVLVSKQLQSLLQALQGSPSEIKVLPMSPDTPRWQHLPVFPKPEGAKPDGTKPDLKPPQPILPSEDGLDRVRDPESVDLLDDTVTSSSLMPHDELEGVVKRQLGSSDSRPATSDSLSKSATRFTAVTSTNSDPFDEEAQAHPLFSLPTILISVTLMVVGLIVYYVIQPIPPEALLARITVRMQESGSEGLTITQLRSAQDDVRRFLADYSDHPSAEQVRIYQDELDLQEHERRLERRMHSTGFRSLSPVERVFIEVLSSSPYNPEQTAEKLRAFIAAFQTIQTPVEESASPYRYTSSPIEICVELARRRLQKLEQELEEINEEQEYVLRRRLDEAADWDSKDPKRAEEIRLGIIELYQNHRWAKNLVDEAKRLTER